MSEPESSSDPAIRPATDADWPQIRAFFDRIVADGGTYAYPEELSSDAARDLWFGQGHVVVLEEGGRVVGSAAFGPNRPGRGDHVGTASFMVDEAARGRGIGRRLGEWTPRSSAPQEPPVATPPQRTCHSPVGGLAKPGTNSSRSARNGASASS